MGGYISGENAINFNWRKKNSFDSKAKFQNLDLLNSHFFNYIYVVGSWLSSSIIAWQFSPVHRDKQKWPFVTSWSIPRKSFCFYFYSTSTHLDLEIRTEAGWEMVVPENKDSDLKSPK